MNTSSALNATSMKNANKYQVLKYIRKGYLSRADISRITNLTRASITYIVDDLYDQGYVIETGFNQQRVGKRSIQLSINPKAGYSIGVSLRRDGYSVNLVDICCNIIKESFISDEDKQISEILNEICLVVDSYIKKYAKKIYGIGIICPGPVDEINGKILNPINFNKWHYFNIKEYFESKYDFKCFLMKDINSFALMEKTFNEYLDQKNFLDIIVDRGIGSSIIINDTLFSGNGFGSELGHVSINSIDGRECQCGNKGCVEQYGRMKIFLKDCKDKGIVFNTWEEIIDAYLSNDETRHKEAEIAINKLVEYYGSALVTFENIVNINNIVFTGILTYRPQIFYSCLENYINSKMLSKNQFQVHIISSSIENIQNKAAGNIVFEEFFNGNLIK